MFDPHHNRSEHRPFGEETPIPDHELGRDNDAANEFFTDGNYPDPADRSEFSCRNCRRAIPADRDRCGYCGTSHAFHRNASDTAAVPDLREDGRNAHRVSETLTGADRWAWRRVLFAVVESRSRLAALAMASVACSFVVQAAAPITKYRLVDEFVDGPPEAVAAPWGHLPAATNVDSPTGDNLLRQAIGRSEWGSSSMNVGDGGSVATTDAISTHLYDESGSGIRSRSELASLESEAADPIWLVPAVAYGPEETGPPRTETPGRSRSTAEQLTCHRCDDATIHDFTGHETGQFDSTPDRAIWQCRTCDAHRYGPWRELVPDR